MFNLSCVRNEGGATHTFDSIEGGDLLKPVVIGIYSILNPALLISYHSELIMGSDFDCCVPSKNNVLPFSDSP